MKFQEKGFFTPPPGLKSNRKSPVPMPRSANGDLFHVIHKVPAGDSPYVRAKRVQMIDKDPSKAVSLFWTAINSGDRVDSALKDMAVVMKQLDRCDEAIEAIKSFRHLCPSESQESIDNVLLELYKRSCRFEEEIQLLHYKLDNIEEDFIFAGKRTKISRFQGKKIHVPIEKEYSRLLGNIAWSYLQKSDYKSAEVYYRKALSFEFDRNKQCNLAICLIHLNKMSEAELLLQTVKAAYKGGQMDESSSKSFERASQMLDDFHARNNPVKATSREYCRFFSPCERRNFKGVAGPELLRKSEYMYQEERVPDSDAQGEQGTPTAADTVGLKKEAAENCLKYTKSSQQLGKGLVHLQESSIRGKSWADMVEEDEEEELLNKFAYENKNLNIMQTPCSLHQGKPLIQNIESLGLNDGYYTQPLHDVSLKNQVTRRSLCFNQHQKLDKVETGFSSPLLHKNLYFGVHGSVSLDEEEDGSSK